MGRGLTLTSNGVVVTGYLETCAGCDPRSNGEQAFAAWFTRAGAAVGFEAAREGPVPDPTQGAPQASSARTQPGSEYAVARGSLAALALGGEVLQIDPGTPSPVGRASLQAVEALSTNIFWPAGVWTSAALVIGLPHSLTAIDPQRVQAPPLWSKQEGPDHPVVDIILDSSGTIDVLYGGPQGTSPSLVQYSPSGQLLGKTKLPFVLPAGQWAALLVPTPQGLLVTDAESAYALLAPAPEATLPSVRASSGFPAPGQVVRLDITLPTHGEVAVSWGDETYETVGGAPLATVTFFHAYVDRGPRDVRVTGEYPDLTTATRTLSLDVGGTPPPDLTPLQTAFAPENQNITFGVLGIVVTAVGGLFTLLRARHRTSRIGRQLARIDEIAQLAQRQPRDAARAVRDYRDGIRRKLAEGALDEPQYHVLETRSARLLTALEARLVAPLEGKLSPAFRRRLAAAFEDATLHASERDALVSALAQEALPDAEKAHLHAILDDLTSASDGGSAPETRGA